MRRILIALVIACIPMDQANKMVLDAKCDVLCLRSGYDAGRFGDKECLCFDKMDYDRAKEKRITIPRTKKHSQLSNSHDPIYDSTL